MLEERKQTDVVTVNDEVEDFDDVGKFLNKINGIPCIGEVSVPERIHEKMQYYVRELEIEKKQEKLSEEEKELLLLGQIYRRKRKMRKYWVLAATLVLVLAFGITSMGGPKKLFETFERAIKGRDQSVVNSKDIVRFEEIEEEEKVYQLIEDEYGFSPVRFQYLPEKVAFLNAKMGNEIQRIDISYGIKDEVEVVYFIRPNYREGSLVRDIEDLVINEYLLDVEEVSIKVKQYKVEGVEKSRWIAEFTYQEVQYALLMMDMEKTEVENILNNLKFL